MATSLLSLPVEILEEVLGFVDNPCHSLNTCKAIYPVARRALWHCLTLKGSDSGYRLHCATNHLRLKENGWLLFIVLEASLDLTEVTSEATSVNLSIDALCWLLSHTAPTRLSITLGEAFSCVNLDNAIRIHTGRPRLTYLSLGSDGQANSHLDTWLPLIAASSGTLRSLVLESIRDTPLFYELPLFPRLETVEIENYICISNSDLYFELLNHCPNLCRLSLSVDYDTDPTILSAGGAGLSSLRISLYQAGNSTRDRWDNFSMESYVPQLKKFISAPPVKLGSLPPSLEEIVMEIVHSDTIRELADLVDRASVFPNLQKLDILKIKRRGFGAVAGEEGSTGSQRLARLASVCAAKGVKLTYPSND